MTTHIRHNPCDMTGDGLRTLLREATSLAAGSSEHILDGPAYTRPPDAIREAVQSERLPEQPIPPAETFAAIADTAARFPVGPGHPRYWAFIAASAHPMGIAAELISSTLNFAPFIGAQVATDYEQLVLRWLGQLCSHPDPGGGILVSGGSMAKVVALAAARAAMAKRGVHRGQGQVAVYFSSAAHFSVAKALSVLGFDSSEWRSVPADREGRFDVGALRAQLEQDRASGILPLAIVATAGTTGTGVIDPLADLARLAEETGCWLHVDAAYGGPVASLPELQACFDGVERADSLSVDPHKWLYVPYEAGAVLVRRRDDLAAAFADEAAYTTIATDAYFGDQTRFQDLGPQQSRSFRALKVWTTIRSIGLATYRDLWRKDIAVGPPIAGSSMRFTGTVGCSWAR